jgi:hypothetical protein
LLHRAKASSTSFDDDDPGVCDKRLLIVHSEFSSPLKMMRRGGNNLSEIQGGLLRAGQGNLRLRVFARDRRT